MNIDKAIKYVLRNIAEEDAFIMLHAMKQQFGWTGTVFCEDDIRQSIADRREADGKEPYTDQQMGWAVATVVNSHGWRKHMEEWMTEQGWDYLNDLIFDEVEHPEEQEDNTMIDNFAELVSAITRLLPESSFGEDNDGQVVIYTNKKVDESDALVELEGN